MSSITKVTALFEVDKGGQREYVWDGHYVGPFPRPDETVEFDGVWYIVQYLKYSYASADAEAELTVTVMMEQI
jgi:hypothetical protein